MRKRSTNGKVIVVMKLSVIVPAYNAGKVLERCMESLLASAQNASAEEFELICIDDGSADDTWKILQSYEAKDSRIHVFHKENGGVGSARNLGLSKVTGHYIAWVDADDYVATDWYESIRSKMAEKPDCIFFDYFLTIGEKNDPCHIRLPEVVSLDAFTYEQSLERELKNFLCNQVIRADLFWSVHFHEEYHMLEDYDVLTKVTPSFQNIVHISKCLYHYVQNESSLTHNVSADVIWQNIQIVKERYDKYCSLGISVSSNDYVMQLLSYLYEADRGQDKAWQMRSRACRTALRRYVRTVLGDKDAARLVKVKAIFAALGLERVLYLLFCIRRALR